MAQTEKKDPAIEPEYDPEQPGQEIGEQQVAAYLRRNPDFFTRFSTLLEDMRIPHERGEAVSLVERQIEVLRDRNQDLQKKLDALIDVAYDNDQTYKALHDLLVRVIVSESTTDAMNILEQQLGEDMKVGHVVIRLFVGEDDAIDDLDEAHLYRGEKGRKPFQSFIKAAQPLCGRLRGEQLNSLFGEAAGEIASCALVPLHYDDIIGLIALGCRDEHRFHPGMDTLYLKRLGEVIAATLIRHLNRA